MTQAETSFLQPPALRAKEDALVSGRDHVDGNNPLTVSELSRALKEHVEGRFSTVSVRGEVSGVKVSSKGHLYFTLKDEKAVLDAVCWSGRAQRLKHRPEEGLEVVANGALSIYPSRSRYQLVVEALEPAGTGALLQLLERRKQKLAGEGLFATERKRKLPLLPRRIAVFASEQSAVWQDIRQRLGQRCPVNTALFPVAVQGREAEGSLLQAFALLKEVLASKALSDGLDDLDVVIVARGGGSIEDLWVFNEETVVRAAVACPLPVVSAIGHESDLCLLDHAADLRAATPTAAVELVVPQRAALLDRISSSCERTRRIVDLRLEESESRLQTTSHALPRALQMRATQARERLHHGALTLRHAFGSFAQRLRERLARQRLSVRWLLDALARARARLVEQEKRRRRALATQVALGEERLLRNRRLLASLSFQRVLERGYAIVRDGKRIVRSACELPEGRVFDTLFADRSILSARACQTTSPPSANPSSADPPSADPPSANRALPRRQDGQGGQGGQGCSSSSDFAPALPLSPSSPLSPLPLSPLGQESLKL